MAFLDPTPTLGLLLLGSCTGFLAGLLGVGGGMPVVPFPTLTFTGHGAAPNLAVKMVIATSITAILFTSISGVRAHHRRGAVRWDLVRRLRGCESFTHARPARHHPPARRCKCSP
jgi:uncharacterized membrane protein YfcA